MRNVSVLPASNLSRTALSKSVIFSKYAVPILTVPFLITVPSAVSSCPPTSTDRKSTRLNSSHLVISYAVFCLKKKKKQRSHHTITDDSYFSTLSETAQLPTPFTLPTYYFS